MAQIDEEFIKRFTEQNPELVMKFKWDAFMTLLDRDKIWEGKESYREMSIKFMTVFREHNVDPEVVIEAIQVLDSEVPKPKQDSDISPSELEGFVSALNKLNKKKEKDDAAEGK